MEEKAYFDVVFVVLVYKNIDVLADFFVSLKLPYTYKVIVVNSFYDEDSKSRCQTVANNNDADFIPVPNKGYSTGNNIGCKHALDNYDFKFLMVANSDVIIHDFSYLSRIQNNRAVIAPDTKMITKKRQNPNIPFKSCLYLKLIDWSYRYDKPIYMTFAHIVNRVYREWVVLMTKILRIDMFKIFSAHGSFIIFTYQAAKDLFPIFNNQMFLYNEELYLAYNCKLHNIPLYYTRKLKLTHLEGASSTPSSNSWANHKQSYSELQRWLDEHKTIF